MRANLRRSAMRFALLLIAACGPKPAASTPGVATAVEPPGTDSPTARRIVDLVNRERVRAGLPALRNDRRLAAAAQMQALQMAHAGKMEHVLKGERYPTPTDRVEAFGYPWRATAENIAEDQDDPEHVVPRWMGSTSHRHNILNPTYTQTGAGYLERGGHKYYVQVFGLPMK